MALFLFFASIGMPASPQPQQKQEVNEDAMEMTDEADIAYEMEEVGGIIPFATTSAMAPMSRGMVPETSYDEYDSLSDPGYVAVATRPLSTFAADVDTAAYANVRRMILAQEKIVPDAVRIEEMINAFTYDDPAPTGDDPIAINAQVAACPWNDAHQLLRVNLKTEKVAMEELPPSNLVFLIDTSGSMDESNKLPLVQRSFALLVEQLTEQDRVSIVTYAGSSDVVLEGVRGDETAKILGAINELMAGGGTHGAEGIQTAYRIAEQYAVAGVNSRVILATDGDFNIGANSQSDLIRLIEEKRASGVFLTVLGFGYGNLKDNNLQALADSGNGHAAYIDTI